MGKVWGGALQPLPKMDVGALSPPGKFANFSVEICACCAFKPTEDNTLVPVVSCNMCIAMAVFEGSNPFSVTITFAAMKRR